MTGLGKGEDEYFKVEIKSLNHKYFEPYVHLPNKLSCLENLIIEKLKPYLTRGKVDVFVNYKSNAEEKIPLDINRASAYLNKWNELSKLLKLENDIKLSDLVSLKDIYSLNELDGQEIENSWLKLDKLITTALIDLDQSRAREGERLLEDLKKILRKIRKTSQEIEDDADKVLAKKKEELCQKLKELSLNLELYEERIALEIALYVNKCDINEELVRIKSHLKEIIIFFQKKEPIGRKLEFIGQELSREINTIGSKAGMYEITKKVILLKSELERFKEQVRNIE